MIHNMIFRTQPQALYKTDNVSLEHAVPSLQWVWTLWAEQFARAAVCSCICDHTWDDMSCDFLDVFKPLLPFRIDEWET